MKRCYHTYPSRVESTHREAHIHTHSSLRSSSKCVSMPLRPGTEQVSLALRKVVHLLTRLLWPPRSFCRDRHTQTHTHVTHTNKHTHATHTNTYTLHTQINTHTLHTLTIHTHLTHTNTRVTHTHNTHTPYTHKHTYVTHTDSLQTGMKIHNI
jgi:hypothetical protein